VARRQAAAARRLFPVSNAAQADQPDPAGAGAQQIIKQICAATRAQAEKWVAERGPDVNSRIEAALEGVKVNDTSFIGVLAEEPAACYPALLQKMKTQVGTDKTQVAMYAITAVKGTLVYYYVFSPFTGTDTVTGMLATHKKNVAALLAANGN
jgi:hypothetical protein